MSDGKIERVARALCRANGVDPDKADYYDEPLWKSWVPSALAAITASRDPEAAKIEMLVEAGNGIIDRMFSNYRASDGREVGIEGDDGEKCWIVHSDDIETLRAALGAANTPEQQT